MEEKEVDGAKRTRLWRPLPPTYFWVALALMIALHFVLPLRQVIPSPWRYAGTIPALAGLVVNIWCSKMFSSAETTIKPFEQSTRLVTRGPYRFSRHPMYAGMAAVLFGLAVFLGSVTPFAVVPAFVAAMEAKFIPAEERAMEETFGEEWREYAGRVRRWI